MRATVGGRFYGRANVKTQTQTQTQTRTQRKTKTAPTGPTLALKVSSDFRWGSLELVGYGWVGGLTGKHAPLEASNEALSKFGRSCW